MKKNILLYASIILFTYGQRLNSASIPPSQSVTSAVQACIQGSMSINDFQTFLSGLSTTQLADSVSGINAVVTIDPTTYQTSLPLNLAISAHNLPLINVLVPAGASASVDGSTIVDYVTTIGQAFDQTTIGNFETYINNISSLFPNAFITSLNASDSSGNCPLTLATNTGNCAVTDFLISKGALFSSCSQMPSTVAYVNGVSFAKFSNAPNYSTTISNFQTFLNTLTPSQRADSVIGVNALDQWGNSPLVLATNGSNIAIINPLIAAGATMTPSKGPKIAAYVNAIGSSNDATTLSAFSTFLNGLSTAQLTDPTFGINAPNNAGNTPLTIATNNTNDALIAILNKTLAIINPPAPATITNPVNTIPLNTLSLDPTSTTAADASTTAPITVDPTVNATTTTPAMVDISTDYTTTDASANITDTTLKTTDSTTTTARKTATKKKAAPAQKKPVVKKPVVKKPIAPKPVVKKPAPKPAPKKKNQK